MAFCLDGIGELQLDTVGWKNDPRRLLTSNGDGGRISQLSCNANKKNIYIGHIIIIHILASLSMCISI